LESLDAIKLEESNLEIEQHITNQTKGTTKDKEFGKVTPTRLTFTATSQQNSSRSMALLDANALEFQSRPQFQTLLIHPPHFITMVPTMLLSIMLPTMPPTPTTMVPTVPPSTFPSDPELARKWLTRLSLSSKILSEIKV